jgi:hypothetical protein
LVDLFAWFKEMPKIHRALQLEDMPSQLNAGDIEILRRKKKGKVNTIENFFTTSHCIACNEVISKGNVLIVAFLMLTN